MRLLLLCLALLCTVAYPKPRKGFYFEMMFICNLCIDIYFLCDMIRKMTQKTREDLEGIVRKLTPVQKEALRKLCPLEDLGTIWILGIRVSTARALAKMGLLEFEEETTFHHARACIPEQIRAKMRAILAEKRFSDTTQGGQKK